MKTHELYILLSVMSIMVILMGTFSTIFKSKLYLSVQLISVLAGIIAGPLLLGFIDFGTWKENAGITLEAARITLAISLMGVALRIPEDFLKKHALKMIGYVFLLMILMFITNAALIYFFLGTGIWMALLLGSVITPTDPVVSSAIVTGDLAEKYIPSDIRNLISTESGYNDGLTIIFFSLPLFMLSGHHEISIWSEALNILLFDLIIPAAIGIFIGWIGGKTLMIAERKNWIYRTYFLGYSTAISLLTLGAARVVESNAVFAVFVAGITFNIIIKGEKIQKEKNVQEAINHFFIIPIFILFGTLIPWKGWLHEEPAFYLLIPTILFLRRMPWIFIVASFNRIINSTYDRIFNGWFGPIGVAAIFYLAYATVQLDDELIWNAGSLIIFSSIVLHGITATPMTKWYSKYGRSHTPE